MGLAGQLGRPVPGRSSPAGGDHFFDETDPFGGFRVHALAAQNHFFGPSSPTNHDRRWVPPAQGSRPTGSVAPSGPEFRRFECRRRGRPQSATHGEAIDRGNGDAKVRQTLKPLPKNSAIWRALSDHRRQTDSGRHRQRKILALSGNHQGKMFLSAFSASMSAASAGRLSVSQVLAPGLSMVISAV